MLVDVEYFCPILAPIPDLLNASISEMLLLTWVCEFLMSLFAACDADLANVQMLICIKIDGTGHVPF